MGMLIRIEDMVTGETSQVILSERAGMQEAVAFCRMAARDGVVVSLYERTFTQWEPWRLVDRF